MKIDLRNVAAAASIALLAACGGSSGNAALAKTFTYGAAQAPSSAESQAATTAQTNLSATAGFNSAPDATKGQAFFAFATDLADGALGATAYGIAPPQGGANFSRSLRSAQFSTATCSTVTATSVTFNSCTYTQGTFTITVNGSITASAGSVTWGVDVTLSGTSNGVTVNFLAHNTGTISVTATKITGNSLAEFSGSASGNGQSVSFGLATAAVIDLTYQSSPSFCITAGSVEVKRVWTQKPQGASGSTYADAAVKIVWTGCNVLTVAHSQ
jgi:hypothetical protein